MDEVVELSFVFGDEVDAPETAEKVSECTGKRERERVKKRMV